jgi:hypothetical protein
MWFSRQAPRLVSLRQHRLFEATAAVAPEFALAQSTHFLRTELPVRLHALRSMACVLPADCAQLPSAAAWEEALAAHCAQHSQQPLETSGVDLEQAMQLQGLASDVVEEVNTRLQHLGADMQLWLAARSQAESHASADHASQVLTQRRIDAFFSRAHYLLIGLRLLAASQARAAAALSGAAAGTGAGDDDDDDGDDGGGALVSRCNVVDVIKHSVEDARAFAREKFGVVPDVLVHPPQLARASASADQQEAAAAVVVAGGRAVCVESQLAFVIHEVLKNSMTSHNQRYGIDADLGPEVTIEVHRHTHGSGGQQAERGGAVEEEQEVAGSLEIVLRDHGAGMSQGQCSRALSWLSTKVEEGEGGVSRRLDNNEHWK